MPNEIKSSPIFTISENMLREIACELEVARDEYLEQAKEYGSFASDSDRLVDQAQGIYDLLNKINKIAGYSVSMS